MKSFSTWMFVILTTATLSALSKQREVYVYRLSRRDMFTNPSYSSSYTDTCGTNACTRYNAECVEDRNCCLCRCSKAFSTYNVSEVKCVADASILAESLFRFVRKDVVQNGIPSITLRKPKTLDKIALLDGNSSLTECKVLPNASYYWSDAPSGEWKPLSVLSSEKLFEIKTTKDRINLEWVNSNSASDSRLLGRVLHLGIQCKEMTSAITFKTKKDYNEDDHVGCLTPGANSTVLIKATLSCSTMTPSMCKQFCRERGYSVAMLKKRTQCSCSEYTEVMLWNKGSRKSSCLMPCGGDEEKFCGGRKTYSSYLTMPEWPNNFKFSAQGALNSKDYRCTQIKQPNLSTAWNKTFLCAQKIGTNIKLKWYSQKPRKRILAERSCIAINYTSNSFSWKENFLCVSREVGFKFKWSYTEPTYGKECLKMVAETSFGRENNYLCAERTKERNTTVSMHCPNTTIRTSDTEIVTKASTTLMTTTEGKNNRTNSLPSSTTPLFPTTASSETQGGSEKKTRQADFIALYVFVAVVSILCFLIFGLLIGVCVRRKMSAKRYCLDLKVQGSNFHNPIWKMCEKDLAEENVRPANTAIQTSRKSRKTRLPSLPTANVEADSPQSSSTTLQSTDTPLQTRSSIELESVYTTPENNRREAPQTLAVIAKERSRTSLKMDCSDYRGVPMVDSTHVKPVNTSDVEAQRNEAQKGIYTNDSNLQGSPLYESIDNCLNPESVYLEVLP